MSKKGQYREEAIPLVSFNPSQQCYQLNDEAIDFIQSVPGPIGVVGVAGMYRTGKSYLLNQMLLSRSDGFGVGPTVNPCTKGLWVWGKPLLGQNQDGETIHILIIDSEGIGALDEDSTHDSRIFALTILLSSCFIYNSVGSIDEAAIQNLSLIVNLTKNIHIKSGQDDEIDFEDYSQYLPSFFWVVRDFSLQLVDQEGEQITSKDYLEKALQPQKGFSDQVEQKNRIRRLLTTFFKERDCATLVRPLTNEENLQNLDKLDFDQLRPEFFEQVINLRKSILCRMKCKQLRGKNLTGEMYCDLIKSYVFAINNGAVPNVENAWSYICKNECHKAQQSAIENYDQVLREVLHNKIPCSLEDLKIYHKMAKESSVSIFKKKAVGEVSEEYLNEVIKKIKQKFNIVRQENERESARNCQSFIQQEFQSIERKLKMNEYKNYPEYEQDLKLFYNYFMENGPKTVNRQQFVSDFIHRATSDGAQYFIKQFSHEQDIQKTLSQEVQKKLEFELQELKQRMHSEINNYEIKKSQLEFEKTEIEMREQVLRENLAIVKSEKEKLEYEFKEQATSEKQECVKVINDQKQKLIMQEEMLSELERNKILSQSEFEKEKALLTQRIQFYEKQMEELSKKDKDQSNDIKSLKKDYNSQIKDISNKYESLNKSLTQKINELQERIYELENELTNRQQKFDSEKRKWEVNENNLSRLLEESQLQIQKLQNEIRDLRNYEEQHAQFLQNDMSKNHTELQEKMVYYEELIKEKEDTLINFKNNFQKEKALLQQKIEFLQVQFEESKQQLEENKRAHEAIMKALESSSLDSSGKLDNRQLQELKENHTREIKALENDFEKAKKRYIQQIDQLNEKNSELEMRNKFEEADFQKEIEQLKEQVQELKNVNQRLEEKNSVLEDEKQKSFKEVEERYINRIRLLEDEIEEIKQNAIKDIRESQAKSEESLAQLKNIYEIERETLERRLAEDKEKWDKRYQLSCDEYQEQIREAQHTYEEEIENLKDDLREQEAQYHNVVQQYEHELALKQQTIETLEKYTKETKESLLNLQSNNNTTLEQYINNFNAERKTFIQKVENLTQELSKKEKENIALQQKKENLEANLKKRESQLTQAKVEMQQERTENSNYIDDLKQKLQQASDEQIQQKIEFSREIALSNQRNEFLSKKNEDLARQNETLIQHYEEKLKILKQEMNQELNEKTDKLQQQRDQMEEKYEKVKKTLKEIEATYNKQLSQIEKEKAIYQEKLANIESKKSELDMKYQAENQNYVMQILQLKEQYSLEKKTLLNEADKYKQFNLQLEQDKNELITNYERDKALWEGKFAFLEQQKEQAKQDLADALKKFEMTLMHLQKARSNEKDEHENNLNELLISMEKKYQNQINELNENNQRSVQDYEDKIRRLNKEIKQLKENMLVEKHGKLGNQMLNEKKLADFIENEKKLLLEIEQLKNERDQKIIDYQRQLDTDKEVLKQKIAEIEQKYKEAEQKRGTLIFEHEKERAKWNLDRDHLLVQKNELQDHIDKLEKKKELLLRENEKLRNESRVTRRSINLVGTGIQSNTALSSSKSGIKRSGTTNQQQSPVSNTSILSKKNSMIQENNQFMSNSNLNQQKNLNDITNFAGIMPYDPSRQMNQKLTSLNSQEDEAQQNQFLQYQYLMQDQQKAQQLISSNNMQYNNPNMSSPQAPMFNPSNYGQQNIYPQNSQPFQIEKFKYFNSNV
ncbi:amine-terminal domain guanylate-binding protein (macronuclear) [Tetrahymena thermophila SB210]|uniref:Amine-terminal domain guanylate-binding protein n=1 Tax=Tetrahymena thermophila (strain SB210) TaxID=312017 RepID=I7MA61_TETTS|nr:amine-terminal domain guanylate-binding protein [Tetrahymena thermophila SB210]EAS03779.1 amine-terminal domain guanylate-binding protein [Tetrahymena thermophila SB210]|eukprot:XP_001024024.1 amine-terminal domain guanylate-binding protein [Tetrahymena thermophila SB210]